MPDVRKSGMFLNRHCLTPVYKNEGVSFGGEEGKNVDSVAIQTLLGDGDFTVSYVKPILSDISKFYLLEKGQLPEEIVQSSISYNPEQKQEAIDSMLNTIRENVDKRAGEGLNDVQNCVVSDNEGIRGILSAKFYSNSSYYFIDGAERIGDLAKLQENQANNIEFASHSNEVIGNSEVITGDTAHLIDQNDFELDDIG